MPADAVGKAARPGHRFARRQARAAELELARHRRVERTPRLGSHAGAVVAHAGLRERGDLARQREGPFERMAGSDDGATQTITWEWQPEAGWLPLCDRIATKVR